MKQAVVGYKVQNLLNFLVENPQLKDEVIGISEPLAATQTEFVMRRRRSLQDEDAITVYLLGMEGTVAPLPLVSQVLQWQAENIKAFVHSHFPGDADLCGIIGRASQCLPPLRKALNATQVDKDEVLSLFIDHIDALESAKVPYPSYYSELLEMVLEDGFTSEVLHSKLFQDAAISIKEWGSPRQQQTFVAICSICPTATARMLLRYCSYDDLSPYVFDYFDQRSVGSMIEPHTYLTIRRRLEKSLSRISSEINVVFITDSSNGAVAANASGAADATFFSVRPFNKPVTLDTLFVLDAATISSFHQLRGGGVSYPLLCAEARECNSRRAASNEKRKTLPQGAVV
ncbi:uncharacterized protein Tco025E_01773 [Trypanosoma conorhini]|uniref:Uncharacterized protein n=1 Tax=Trypanosoma conorhini TaxID=83891 RepID=A0A422Q7P8_9TRYP|nr:uncharacterized protein Tco025E_01773 [Trypanosoma conorhini]RNF25986.1 hypothetical protein Tco025E_01773 [Trypanosoma conorhini]